MERPKKERRVRVRVELRLPPETASELHSRAERWEVTVSVAGNRLIKAGLAQIADDHENLCHETVFTDSR